MGEKWKTPSCFSCDVSPDGIKAYFYLKIRQFRKWKLEMEDSQNFSFEDTSVEKNNDQHIP